MNTSIKKPSESHSKRSLQPILLALVLPPPLHGMSKVNQHVVDLLDDRDDIQVVNLVKNPPRGRWMMSLKKTFIVTSTSLRILFAKHPIKTLYTVANSRIGQLLNILMLIACRCRGTKVILHHHSFGYVNAYDWRMAILSRLMTKKDTHIYLCECMQTRFESKYGSHSKSIIASNPVEPMLHLEHAKRDETSNPPKEITLGHLSNLCVLKGLKEVLEGFRHLLDNKIPARLILAGPAGHREKKLIEAAQKELGDRIMSLGSVYGDSKAKFYSEIDLFLFPTRHKTEAQPLVLLEAMSAGIPVLTVNRGCIAEQVGDAGGLVVPEDNFPQALNSFAKRWLEDEDYRQVTSQQAKEQSIEMEKRSSNGFHQLLEEILS